MIVGIDVAKATFDAAFEVEGRLEHRQFEYTPEGMSALLAQTPKDAHYVMEATGVYHARLALFLHEAKRRVTVVNPLIIKRFAQMQLARVKSDKADAKLVRQYALTHALTVWAPTPTAILELTQAHRWLDDLIGERTRLQNREEAHLHQGNPSAFVQAQMAASFTHLNAQIKACERHLEALVQQFFPKLYEHLCSIPSIGPKTAIELIIAPDGFRRFQSIKALAAFVGLSPTTYRSGTSIKGKGTIAKFGQARLRQLLYLCSWTAKRCNPACRVLHARLHHAGKPPKVINIAIAHKLLRQAFAVAMSDCAFSPERG